MESDRTRFAVMPFLFMALAVGACAKKDDGGTDTTGAAARMGDTAAIGASGTAAWSDANIFALLDEANVGDSTHGALASTKGTSSAVRDYGKQMMRDHHTLRAQGEALAKRLKVTPAPPADDNLPAAALKASATLNSTTKGKDFDKAYIDHEVETHKTLLELLTKAMSDAQSTELKNMIQKAAPTLETHLDRAQSIQRNMQ